MAHIWTNDVCDYTQDTDEYPMEGAYEAIEDDFARAKEKLNKNVKNTIVCIANVARWDGKRFGFQWVGSNVSDCLDFARRNGETVRVFVENGDLMATSTGHDNPVNPTTMWFRKLNRDVEEYEFEDMFCENYSSAWDMTEALGKYWKENE